MRTEKQKMLSGEWFFPSDPELVLDLAASGSWMVRYQAILSEHEEKWSALLEEHMGSVGNNVIVRPPFFCDYGYNIKLGDRVFLNFNCVILDGAPVTIGNNTRIGPAVQIYTATHLIDAEQRLAGLEMNRSVNIGENVWIGGGAIILPGVTIGNNVVIGAGSVVTCSVPDNLVVMGNPARAKLRAND